MPHYLLLDPLRSLALRTLGPKVNLLMPRICNAQSELWRVGIRVNPRTSSSYSRLCGRRDRVRVHAYIILRALTARVLL